MKETPLVSVLIVTYNAELYIYATVKSCLEQTYKNIEILILDNNSQDNTCDIIESFKNSKIKLFKKEKNLGPYLGLNYLLDRANGNYIAIQDHDDIWFPDKISKQVEFLNLNNNYIACGTNVYYYFEERDLFILQKKPFKTDYVNHTSLMFRHQGYKYDNQYTLTDEHFEKKVLLNHGQIACLQESLVIHRIKKDNSNLSLSRFKMSLDNFKQFFYINGYKVSSFVYLSNIVFTPFIPNNLKWFIRKNITLKQWGWLSKDDFTEKYPNIKLQ